MAMQRGGRHFERLAQVSREPGVFVYDGSAVAVEYHPTGLKTGKNEPVLDEDGMPVLDSNGEPQFKKVGKFRFNDDGSVMLGGKPKEAKVELKERRVGGVVFKAGAPVKVSDPRLAQKLRCLHGFSEVDQAESAGKDEKRGPGRPHKSDPEK